MRTNQTRSRRTIVNLHQVARWLDHPDGAAVTMCGLTLQYGDDSVRRIIDSPDAITQECPLCAAAELVDSLTVEDIFDL